MPRFEDLPGEHAHTREIRRDRRVVETSDEKFDRLAFALRALDLVRPERTRIAVCVEPPTGRAGGHVRIESGRAWGSATSDRWAILSIPAAASRRAIVLAVSELSGAPTAYALDVLRDLAERAVA
jgi:hypothetical protein